MEISKWWQQKVFCCISKYLANAPPSKFLGDTHRRTVESSGQIGSKGVAFFTIYE
jgi:hypothetical protein